MTPEPQELDPSSVVAQGLEATPELKEFVLKQIESEGKLEKLLESSRGWDPKT